MCSYRTYEEWKLFSRTSGYFGSYSQVLTVPMRNGNGTSKLDVETIFRFLPYLWGMETPYDIVISSRLGIVLTVPMRNGNNLMHCNHLYQFVLTVPMRNGNFFNTVHKNKAIPRSYRTYEEWKQVTKYIWPSYSIIVLTVPMRNGNSAVRYIYKDHRKSSYRTYEEWKHKIF